MIKQAMLVTRCFASCRPRSEYGPDPILFDYNWNYCTVVSFNGEEDAIILLSRQPISVNSLVVCKKVTIPKFSTVIAEV